MHTETKKAGTVILLTLLLAAGAFGGDGKVVVGPPHMMDLNVYYHYNETDMESFKEAFTEASKLMFNATNGQLQFGTIRVSKNSAFQDKADFWVLSGDGDASSGGFGILGNASGAHVTVYREQHRFTAEDGPHSNERGHFGIVHELGHHAFDLRNEYHGPTGAWSYCVSSTSSVVCVMDGGTSVHPTHHRTEWCTDASGSLSTAHHDGTPTNHQESHHGESCWEALSDYCSTTYAAAMSEPTTVDTSNPTGHVDPAWIVVGDQLRYVICVDKSYSMVGSKLAKAKAGADLFVDLGHEGTGERIAVTSFSGGSGYDPAADVNFPLANVVNDTVKTNARAAISTISVENMTAIGDGMRVSLDELEKLAADDACAEVVILLSDGEHNYGSENPDDVIPDLRDRGVRVFTIGLGDPADPVYPLDEVTLQHIADETGGLYMYAPTEADLATIYTAYCGEARGSDVCGEDTGELSPDKYTYEQVYVDAFTKEATFVLHWPNGNDSLDLELETPDGMMINPKVAAGDPDIKYWQMGYYEYYRVRKPMRGTWKLWINALRGPTRIPYTTQTLAESPGVDFSVFVKKHLFKYPQVPVIQASVSAGAPVAGVKVEGVVIRPHPEQGVVDSVAIKLYDDGLYIHGDEVADDGIYSNRFNRFTYDGSYQIRLTATNENGTEAIPDEPVEAGWVPKAIPPFTRVAKNTVIIMGIPQQMPVPKVASASPAQGRQAESLDVTILGNNFVQNATVEFSGGGISVHGVGYAGHDKLIAQISIDAEANLGPRDVRVTNPGGLNSIGNDVFDVLEERPCFPSKYSTFNDWAAMGRPVCWCSRSLGGNGYQCDGDADGDDSGIPFKYRVFTGDMSVIIANWRKRIGDPMLNPCADVDHKDSGVPFRYRVFTGDLSRLVKNWRKQDKELPGNCPRLE
ncbi:MAG: VWA domain-containing protein [Phycisphaerales bacterium]|nr:MAG: VWA domain-containing protein [Phycisphaerales bacterium]